MWLTGIGGLEVLAVVVAGLLAVVGAVVAFELLLVLVQSAVVAAGRFLISRFRGAEAEGRGVRGPAPSAAGPSLIPMPDPELVKWQAWWRLRC